MAKNLEKVSKSKDWFKSMTGETDKKIKTLVKNNLTVAYLAGVFSEGRGDYIHAIFSSEVLTQAELNNHFSFKKVGGKIEGPVCEIILKD